MKITKKILHPTISVACVALVSIFLFSCAHTFDPQYDKAKEKYGDEKYVDAIDALHVALRKWDESDGTDKKAKAYQLLGKSYKKIRKFDKAMDAFSQAVELSNLTYDSAYMLGHLYVLTGDTKMAVKSFQNALRMKKDAPLALVGLGNAYFGLKNYTKAREAFQRVIDTSPGVELALKNIRITDKKLNAHKKTNPRRKK